MKKFAIKSTEKLPINYDFAIKKHIYYYMTSEGALDVSFLPVPMTKAFANELLTDMQKYATNTNVEIVEV